MSIKHRALKNTIIVAIAGFVIAILIAYVERSTLNTYNDNLPYISLGDNIKSSTAQTHVWFEELMTGRSALSFERDVVSRFASDKVILQGAYDGKETAVGTFSTSLDEETKAILKESIISLEKLVGVTQERWDLKQLQRSVPVERDSNGTVIPATASSDVAGDALQKKYDTHYQEFQAKINTLIERIKQNVKSETRYLSTLSWISIVLLVIAFGTVCVLLYNLQNESDNMVLENEARIKQQNLTGNSLTGFIEAISAGNYSVDLQLEEEKGLSNTLINMRDKLRENADDDRERNWSTTGLAQVGEILRTSSGTKEDLYDNIIKFVVKYTRSNQGGLFVLNEESETDKYLELMSCYAFERKKFLENKITLGEGLIGQAFLEGERIYLKEVPEEYISITSGLGGSNPNALLIVPLKVNGKIYGVIELATFTTYEDFEIELVEKLAESIGSTISTVRTNESTRILLERTQQQAEEMRAQEEEMRQNMEELEATQEEMRRKETHIQTMLDGEKERNDISQKNRGVLMELTKNRDLQLGNKNASLEKITSTIGKELSISRCSIWTLNNVKNKLTCEKLYNQSSRSFEAGAELMAKDYPDYFEAITREEIINAKDALNHAATREFTTNYMPSLGIQSLLNVPFFDEGRIAGIVCCEQQHNQKEWTEESIEFLKSCADLVTVGFNTTKVNTMIQSLNEVQETLQTIIDNIPRAVFWKDKELRFQGCNKIFAKVAGLSSCSEMLGNTDFDMPWKDHAEAYRADDLAVMNSRKARLDLEERNVNSEGEESWVLTSKVPVMNQHGEVVGVLGMFEDITQRKQHEAFVAIKLKELEELKKIIEKRNN